jgi:hypothetical protein
VVAAISVARAAGAGSRVTVEGVVTAEAGRTGSPSLLVIQDTTAAIAVKLPDGAPRSPRGTILRVTGRLADPYGQLEIRPAVADLVTGSTGDLPEPLAISAAGLGESVESRLVVLDGTLDAPIVRETSGDLVLRLVDGAGIPFKARATKTSGLETTAARKGARLRLTGIVGQRASRKGALEGYRVWLRDPGDLLVLAAPASSASSPPSPVPSPASPGPASGGSDAATMAPALPISAALRLGTGRVRVEAVVTIPAMLLDATGRRLIVQDATAAVEVLLPAGLAGPLPGARLRIDGELGTAYGTPRLRATEIEKLGRSSLPAPRQLGREPGPSDEGELVRVTGRVADLRRLGDRWRAELRLGATPVLVAGLAGAGIPAATLAEGTSVTVVGVVRRPHPAATDRRFAIVPRGPSDIHRVAAAPAAAAPAPAAPASRSIDRRTADTGRAAASRTPSAPDRRFGPVDADLAALPGAGTLVRVGGLIVTADRDGVLIDDGTATSVVRLVGEAAELLALLEPGDAVSAVGRVTAGPEGVRVDVDDPAGLVRLGDLGEALPFVVDEGARPTAVDPADATRAEPPSPVVTANGAAAVPAPGRASSGASPGAGPATVPLAAGIGASVVLACAWAATVAARRRRDRRRLGERVAARVAALVATTSDPPSGPAPGALSAGLSPEHEASVREPA